MQDFRDTLDFYKDNTDVIEYLERFISAVVSVRTVEDMNLAFDSDIQRGDGKTVMLWEE